MLDRIKNRLKFQLELFILRGPLYRLLAIALLIAFIAMAAGLLVFLAGAAFMTVAEAVWWAFLRLTDPGYLGDDQGALLRTVSTIVTVLGYVIFLGALVAIMTQWFQQTMNRLQAGLTPIVQKQHILVLGWTNRTDTIVRELFHSEGRVQRFLQRFGARRLRVVLLSEEDPPGVVQELHDQLGKLWEPTRFIVRSGSPLRLEHLQRVDALNASVILLPASELSSRLETTVDADVVKTLITIENAAADREQTPPLVVAELMDARKVSLAKQAYSGPIEVVASDEFLSRLIAQNLRHAGLSFVYSELLGHQWGNEIYIRAWPSLVGTSFGNVFAAFSTAIPIGVIRRRDDHFETLLNPTHDLVIQKDDRLALIAEDYDHAVPDREPGRAKLQPDDDAAPQRGTSGVRRRILMLGWNHKTPTLLRELDRYTREESDIDIISRTDKSERDEIMERLDVRPQCVGLKQIEADFTSPSDLARFEPATYDTILLLASDWTETDASTDARTILGYLILHELLAGAAHAPHILVELRNPENVSLFQHKEGEVLVSPVVISHVLTQVALRRELRAVFEELFGPHGAEIRFRPVHEVLSDATEVRFDVVQQVCARRGEIALGLRLAQARDVPGGVMLNPARNDSYKLSTEDEIIVLAG